MTRLLLDFEDGMGGVWGEYSTFGEAFDYEIVPSADYNLSGSYLEFSLPPGRVKGSLSFNLQENGIDPIPLTSRTSIAWSWKASLNIDTNGIWIVMIYLDTLTGQIIPVRCVSWTESTYDVLRTYYEPKNTWVHHEERVATFIRNRLWESEKGIMIRSEDLGRIILTGVAIGASRADGIHGAIDNIWVGEPHAPDSIDTIDPKQQVDEEHFTRIRAFSYGYVDHDLLPDRIDLYRDRVEILDGRSSEFSRRAGRISGENGVEEKEKELLAKVTFKERRNPSAVTIADLGGSGQSDLLIQFDDRLGQVYLENDLHKGRLLDRTRGKGRLRSVRNRLYGSAPADIDNDGDLDLALFNPINRRGKIGGLRMARNEGFYFREWTERSSIERFNLFGGMFSDLDGDGDQDFFAAYRTYTIEKGRPFESRVFINDGTGVFSSSKERFFLPDDLHIEGAVLADFDNDADIDIYVVVNEKGFTSETILAPNILYENDGNGFFRDVSTGQAEWEAHKSESAIAEDFDQDGDIDIIDVTTTGGCVYYRNEGAMCFRQIRHDDFTCTGIFKAALGVDFDHDGDIDLALKDPEYLEAPVVVSNGCAKGGFVQVNLRGLKNNRNGIGAKVYIHSSGSVRNKDTLVGYREIQVQKGFGANAPPVAHFGIDSLEVVDLVVIFPSVDGAPPVVVERKGIKKNSFVWIVETNNPLLSRWHSIEAEKARYEFSARVFSIPAWLSAIFLFLVLAFAGVNIRARFDHVASYRLPHRVLPGPALVAISTLSSILLTIVLYRSWIAGVPAILASVLVVATEHDLVGLLGKKLGGRHDGESEDMLLIQLISRILHADKRFRFLLDFTNGDASTVETYRYVLDSGLSDLDRCVEMMRRLIPERRCWKDAARALASLKQTFAAFLAATPSDDVYRKLRQGYNTTIDDFNEALGECRRILRARHSIDFNSEWEGFLKSRLDELRASGIELSFDTSKTAGAGIYLSPGEFRDIFSNQISNSSWAVSEAMEKRIRMVADLDHMNLTVTWLDTGCGIDEETGKILFKREARSKRPGGKGMGCYNSAQILDSRQGRVWVDDPPEGWMTAIVMKFVRTK